MAPLQIPAWTHYDGVMASRFDSIRRRIPVLVAAIIMLAGSGACTMLRETIGLGPLRPTVSLQAIEVSKVSMTSIELVASVRVDNPNDFALTFRNLAYRLDAGNLEIAVGHYREDVRISAESRGVLRLPVTVHANNAVKLFRMLLQSKGELMTEMKAKADFVTPFGDMEVKFEDRRPVAKLAGF